MLEIEFWIPTFEIHLFKLRTNEDINLLICVNSVLWTIHKHRLCEIAYPRQGQGQGQGQSQSRKYKKCFNNASYFLKLLTFSRFCKVYSMQAFELKCICEYSSCFSE